MDGPMIQYSILLPQRDAVETVACRLTELCAVLAGMGEPFELLCIDDHSGPPHRAWLKQLLLDNPCLRVLELREARGLDAALAAGIRHARGAAVVALEASDRYDFRDLPRLAERLARADLVWGCRRGHRFARWWRTLSHLPRTIFSGSLVRDPECVFWAARRELFTNFAFTTGWHRWLPELASEQGYRVAELHVAHRWHARGPAIETDSAWSSLWPFAKPSTAAPTGDAIELSADESGQHRFEIIRIDPPQPLSAPGPTQPESPRDRHRLT
ncbi:MAG: glycosyltransferase [Planctomycetia bacterium]|nr:glycosyltransferase [Planctomycetia bacterium]